MPTIHSTELRFQKSLWRNINVALRSINTIYAAKVSPLGLSVIEGYCLQALYVEDGLHASELSREVGRAATSFTPILDGLEQKNLIKRRTDPHDRRAVHVFLTPSALSLRADVLAIAQQMDAQIREVIAENDLQAFLRVLEMLQSLQAATLR